MSDLRLPSPRRLPRERLAARRDHLLRELRAPRRRSLPRAPRALVLLPIGAVLAGGAFAATQLFDASAPDDLVNVRCYERASLDSAHRAVAADSRGVRGPRPGAQSSLEMCARLWQRGRLGGGGAPPQLQACVYRGQVAVFPGGAGTCRRLALDRLSPAYRVAQSRATALQDRIAAELERCANPRAVARRIDAILREAGHAPAGLALRDRPGRDCGPALPRRTALGVASAMATTVGGGSRSATDCERTYGGLGKATAGESCDLGLLAIDCPDAAHAERAVRRALVRLDERGWRVDVVAPRDPSARFCYTRSLVYPAGRVIRLVPRVQE